MIRYKHPQTKEEKIVSFPFRWLLWPWCAIELILKNQFVKGVLAILPVFTIVWMFMYKSILSKAYESAGFERI